MADLLTVDGVTKRFGGVNAVQDVSFAVAPGTVVGLVGPNGAGKTTLFNVLTGFVRPDRGDVRWHTRTITGLAPHRIARLGIGRTFQTLRLAREMSVFENVLLGIRGQRGEELLPALFDPGLRREEAANHRRALALLDQVGIADEAGAKAEALSYGQQKLLSLAMCLALEAELLLLDEPVAGIAPAMCERILTEIRRLRSEGRAVVVIEHDLDALTAVADRVIVMSAGRKIADGVPAEVLVAPEVLASYLTPSTHA